MGGKLTNLRWILETPGVDATIRNSQGKTARDLAAEQGPKYVKVYDKALPRRVSSPARVVSPREDKDGGGGGGPTASKFRNPWEENTPPQRRLYVTAMRAREDEKEDFTRALEHGAEINFSGYLDESYVTVGKVSAMCRWSDVCA